MMAWLMQWLRPYRAWVAVALFLAVAVIATGVGLMVASGRLLSEAALRPPILDLIIIVTAVRFFALSRAGLRYVERLVAHDVTFRLLQELRVWVYERLMPLAPFRLWGRRRGDLLARLVGDIDTLQNLYIRILAPAIASLAVALLTVGALALVDLPLALTIGGFHAAAGLVIPWWLASRSRGLGERRQHIRARFSAAAAETLSGRVELASWGATPSARRRLARLASLDDRIAAALHRLTAIQEGLLTGLTWLGLTAALVLGIPLVTGGVLTGPALAALVLGVMATFEGVTGLASAVHTFGSCQASADRLRETVSLPPSRTAPASAGPVPPGPLQVRFRSVAAGYGDRPVLNGVDLDLSPGRMVAVVGPNGSGKSTLARMVAGFLLPVDGTVTVNGVSLEEVGPASLRRRLAIVSQTPHVFLGSVREHMTLGAPDAGDVAIRDALHRVGLGTWLTRLPDGLDTGLGEGGATVSGGEARRLALARALVMKDRLFVLDEPFNHVDPATADRIMTDLADSFREAGTLLISHRLTGLDTADEILVMDHGQVVQRGRFEELAQTDGLFLNLLEVEQDVLTNAGSALK